MLILDKRLSSLMIGLLLLVFTACIPQPGSIPNTGEDQTPEVQSSLANTKWELISLSEAGVGTPVLKSPTVTLEFDAGGQVVGAVNLSFTEGRAILVIWGEDGNVLLSDHAEASYFSRVLPSTQDYYILVRGRPDGETVYRMDLTIPPSVLDQ